MDRADTSYGTLDRLPSGGGGGPGNPAPDRLARGSRRVAVSEGLKTTPLHAWHREHGGKMVEFGGWHMPVQYSGIIDEHRAVRQRAGLFDVSHMGELRLRGPQALAAVQRVTTNDASTLETGQAQYTVMTTPEGGVVDDLLVYRLATDDYLLVVNAATTGKDRDWIRGHLSGDVELVDESGSWAQLAIQGPRSEAVLSRVVEADLTAIGYYRSRRASWGDGEAMVSRTGYTGEDGFEVYLPPDDAVGLAEALLAAGEAEGLLPCGLGARDTLRLEAGMLLYGNDMDEGVTPVEAGLRWLVKPDKGEFVGREALVAQLEAGVERRLAGFRLQDKGVPRHGYRLLDGEGTAVGEVTSGTFSPTLEVGIGLGYVPAELAAPGSPLAVEARGRSIPAEVVKTPFYKRER